MHVRDVQQRVPRRADLAIYAEPFRHRAQLLQSCNSQFPRSASHQPERTQADVVITRLKLVLRLVAHADWRKQTPAEFSDVIVLVSRYRVLEPVESKIVSSASHIQSLAEIVTIIRVEHQLHFVPNNISDTRHHLEHIRGAHNARVYLVCSEPGLYQLLRLLEVALRRLMPWWIGSIDLSFAPICAQQPVNRHSRRLPCNVPQRHIHRRPRVHVQTPPAAQYWQSAPQPLPPEGVLPQDLRLQHIQNRPELSAPTSSEIPDKAVPLDSLISHDS